MLLQIEARAQELGLDISFKGPIDHLSPNVHGYKVRRNMRNAHCLSVRTAGRAPACRRMAASTAVQRRASLHSAKRRTLLTVHAGNGIVLHTCGI